MPFSRLRTLHRGCPKPSAGWTSACLAILISGCATPPPPPAPPPPPPVMCERAPTDEGSPPPAGTPQPAPSSTNRAQTEGNVALLAYADRVRTMSPGELGSEIARLTDTSDLLRGPYGDLQLAVALGQTRQPQDLQRAQFLLQRLAASPTDDARRLQPLGRLIAARYAEQRRVEDQLDKQTQAMRDNQKRLDQLNERLEAVRAIERSLTRSSNNGTAAPAVRP